jgi:hypothetical protein
MARLSDHTLRDAQHAARSAIRVEVSRYIRRMDELAAAHIKSAIERGEVVDGTELGREAGTLAISTYITPGEPQPAINSAGATASNGN